jgi:hypothetical protein
MTYPYMGHMRLHKAAPTKAAPQPQVEVAVPETVEIPVIVEPAPVEAQPEGEELMTLLEEAPTPSAPPAEEKWSPYWTKTVLLDYAAKQGLTLPTNSTKSEVVAALTKLGEG